MFNWELVHKKDCYGTLMDWWTDHQAFGGKVIEYKSLPNRVFLVSNENRVLFAVPVYVSDSDFCYIGWVTSNPNAGFREKHGALEYLYEGISKTMKEQGYDHILSKANARSLQRVAEKSGFINVGETTYHVKNL